ncbi:MAG TPA: tetratricopeptide repeat protein [Bacteroidia bacterium]|nr:tetratricopeptide repeat protein [Bacteroidia bacterium]
MGLFGKKTPPRSAPVPKGPSITQNDREWINRAFKFVINNFGLPGKNVKQIDFTSYYFPETFKERRFDVNLFVKDLSEYLLLDIKRITVKFEKDIRDMPQTPYQVYGDAFYSELEIINDDNVGRRYFIHIGNNLNDHQDILVIKIIIELLKIKIIEKEPQYSIEGISNLFVYVMGIYFGLGYILSTKLYEIGTEVNAGWKRTWKFNSGVPPQVMAYALAFYVIIQDNGYPAWVDKLTQQMMDEFDLSIEYLSVFNVDLFLKEEKPEEEFIADEIIKVVQRFYSENNFEAAISELRKAIPLTSNSRKLASRYCSLGYYYLRLEKYEESIPYFLKSLEFIPDFAYSLDNLGFAYLMIDKLDEGRESIEKAMATGSDDRAYSFRNLGIYHMKKNEMEEANDYFQETFETKRKVDLLEYFYAQFQFLKGDKKKGMRYLEMAVAKGEPEAIELIEKLSE